MYRGEGGAPNTPLLLNTQDKPRLRQVGALLVFVWWDALLRSHTQKCHGDGSLRKLINVGN